MQTTSICSVIVLSCMFNAHVTYFVHGALQPQVICTLSAVGQRGYLHVPPKNQYFCHLYKHIAKSLTTLCMHGVGWQGSSFLNAKKVRLHLHIVQLDDLYLIAYKEMGRLQHSYATVFVKRIDAPSMKYSYQASGLWVSNPPWTQHITIIIIEV